MQKYRLVSFRIGGLAKRRHLFLNQHCASMAAMRPLRLMRVKQLLEKEKGHVVATCRNPNEATCLHRLKSKSIERLSVLDV
ncbi:hypothetical protein ACFX11_036542 [Malus domestica]